MCIFCTDQHKAHKIINFANLHKEENKTNIEGIKKVKELVNTIINFLEKFKENLDVYIQINEKLNENILNMNLNYQNLKNMRNLIQMQFLKKDINQILNMNDINKRFQKIMSMYDVMNGINSDSINFGNDNDLIAQNNVDNGNIMNMSMNKQNMNNLNYMNMNMSMNQQNMNNTNMNQINKRNMRNMNNLGNNNMNNINYINNENCFYNMNCANNMVNTNMNNINIINNNQFQQNNQEKHKTKRDVFLLFTVIRKDRRQIFNDVSSDMRFSDVIEEFKRKYDWFIINEKTEFSCNGRKINPNRTVQENNLKSNDEIEVK